MADTFRNAFRSRFSDRSGLRTSQFIQMYAPQVVRELLKNENLLMPKAAWLLGLPGSGKTSILRLFSLEIVKYVIDQGNKFHEIYSVLSESGIIIDDKVRYIGIYLPIDDIFSDAENIVLENINSERLFYTIFNLRVAKKLAQSLEELNSTQKPEKIIGIPSDRIPPALFSKNTDTHLLLDKVQSQEILISKLLNSFPGTPIPDDLELHSRFSSLDLLNAQKKYYNVDFILMVDDAHDLYPHQFSLLMKSFQKREWEFPRWVASRKHIAPPSMLLDSNGSTTDQREEITIDLDKDILRQPSIYRNFIKLLVNNRLKLTDALITYTYEEIQRFIADEIPYHELDIERIRAEQKNEGLRIRNKLTYEMPDLEKYLNGEDNLFNLEDVELLLIKSNRAILKSQPSLFNIEDEAASKDKQVADIFWKKRAGVSLYCGLDDIILSSNSNVEQFMRVFAYFIDRIIYREELNKDPVISAKEQRQIYKKITSDYVDKIVLRLQYGNKINQLIDNLCRFFQHRTYEPNAPHAPGVTQFALLASEIEMLCNGNDKELNKILTTAVAFNIIVPEPPQSQGTRGSEKKHPFSINRLLCIHYELPLQKGDFQRIPLKLLREMCNRSMSPEEIKGKKGSQGFLWSE